MTVTSFDSITFDHFSIDPAPLGDGEQTITGQFTLRFTYDQLIDPVTRENDPMHLYGYKLSVHGTTADSPTFINDVEELEHIAPFERSRVRLDCGTIFNRRQCNLVQETTRVLRFPSVPLVIRESDFAPRQYEVKSERLSLGIDTSALDTAKGETIEFTNGPFGGFRHTFALEDRTFLYAEIVSVGSEAKHLTQLSGPLRNEFETAAA